MARCKLGNGGGRRRREQPGLESAVIHPLGHELRADRLRGILDVGVTLDAPVRLLRARAWAAGAGPGGEPLTIDLDSTICETYGLAKEGVSDFTYTHTRGYHPLLAIAAGTGDVLHARLRGGNANTVRGAGSNLAETIERVRAAGASGDLVVGADSGFHAHAVVAAARTRRVRYSITIRQFADEKDAVPVRLIARRVKPARAQSSPS